MKRLEGKIALVTGASRGIGAAIAKRFAAEGAHLVLTARTVGSLEAVDDEIQKLSGTPATIVPLDLRQMDMIDRLGGMLFERFGKLDVLVGNAGMLGSLSTIAHAAPSEVEDVFDVNVLANYRLLRSMDPLLRLSTAGRVVMVTSGASTSLVPYWGPYAASKAALDSLTLTYAAEMQSTQVRVNLLDPGAVATRMRAQAFPLEDPATLPQPESVTEWVLRLCEENAPSGKRVVVY